MNSNRPSEDLSLELPTTDRDVAALRRAREAGTPSLLEALTRLSKLELPFAPVTQRRQTSEGWEPFVLEADAPAAGSSDDNE